MSSGPISAEEEIEASDRRLCVKTSKVQRRRREKKIKKEKEKEGGKENGERLDAYRVEKASRHGHVCES